MLTPLLVFVGALLIAFGATPIARRVAPRLGVMDHPNPRKVHARPMPLLGGAAIVVASIATLLIFQDRFEFQQLVTVLFGAAFMSLLGVYDDRWGLRPILKLLGQFLAACLLILSGVRITSLPFEWLNFFVSLIWIVGLTNSLNLLDNMDGLSSGVAAVCAAFFMVTAALSRQTYVGALAAALLGAALGFLFYNFNPASIFMGDTGSLFLGFMLAAIGVKLRFPENVPFVTWMIPVLIMGMPIFDTTLVFISRLRRGKNPLTTPGKDHVSHRLVALGFTTREAVMIHYLIGGAFGLAAVLVTQSNVLEGYLIGGGMALFGLYGLWFFEFKKK
ncbi:MAG: undecaprenyl/decaprenyl-phosphate alpha-N-acetylglucosaminyl 1-phosphate transferase [Thermoflexales bacterium]|nr:undecaprenyl/decaprenyl-phosphate alpha-N-acetylglucosaminyl 1-phosphate transferase [Thermoflexales bacterium]